MPKEFKNAKIFLVGCGGIGCEIIKILALSPCASVHMIDLDSIDLSNLNRQFIFNKTNIGQPKSTVCAAFLRSYLSESSTEIVSYHSSVFSSEFNIHFISQFDAVINALDNVQARSHVNSLTVAASVPLIDAGTAGLAGNVVTYTSPTTECFHCSPKPPPKRPPVCTIRTVPSTPAHCCAWARMALERLYGGAGGELLDLPVWLGSGEGPAMGDGGLLDWAMGLRKLLFAEKITEQLNTAKDHSIWTYGPPTALGDIDLDRYDALGSTAHKTKKKSKTTSLLGHLDSIVSCSAFWSPDHSEPLTPDEASMLFVVSACRLSRRSSNTLFDKDDDDAMRFVAAAAALRMLCYHITPASSPFDLKAVAGAIVPAVATTNAIAAGLAIRAVEKILVQKSQASQVLIAGFGKRPIFSFVPEQSKPACAVCGPPYIRTSIPPSAPLSELVSLLTSNGFDSNLILMAGGNVIHDSDEWESDDGDSDGDDTADTLRGSDLISLGLIRVSDDHGMAVLVIEAGDAPSLLGWDAEAVFTRMAEYEAANDAEVLRVAEEAEKAKRIKSSTSVVLDTLELSDDAVVATVKDDSMDGDDIIEIE
eukprot:gnl/Dysnectes_brevis/4801_a6629_539.p1 GENE.gnl/Dysnectes_brevis/4801_a6629_539~~gnl/Dysnectes_brevis/4801_a6629_539.p1  ORF type:complete len:591 (-),score=101.75 gnl/Dysnectes_brevis/4801_a6629_539:90-1862(-)